MTRIETALRSGPHRSTRTMTMPASPTDPRDALAQVLEAAMRRRDPDDGWRWESTESIASMFIDAILADGSRYLSPAQAAEQDRLAEQLTREVAAKGAYIETVRHLRRALLERDAEQDRLVARLVALDDRMTAIADAMDESDPMTGPGVAEFADSIRAALDEPVTGEPRCSCSPTNLSDDPYCPIHGVKARGLDEPVTGKLER